MEGDLPDMPVRWAIYHPDDYNSVIVATEVGIWTSNDVSSNSINWTPNSAGGIANVRVDMLRIRKRINWLPQQHMAEVFLQLIWSLNLKTKQKQVCQIRSCCHKIFLILLIIQQK